VHRSKINKVLRSRGFLTLSEVNATAVASSGHRPMGFPEFVIVIASIMSLNPIAMDMMLPALPNIASAFHITVANRPQMVLSIFSLASVSANS
jgi:DHA1 family bicyclomycin/chloramphenicol resistance-like MFS transporter